MVSPSSVKSTACGVMPSNAVSSLALSFSLSPVIDEVRAVVANEGWAGLQRLAKKYAIPVALLAEGLGALGESAPAGGSAPAESVGVQ